MKGSVTLPEGDAQLKHIFGNRKGHLPDTKENRQMLVELANDMDFHKGKDKYGNDWHIRNNENGTQDWVRHMNQKINEGGRNASPLPWNNKTGLNRNPWED